jgi:hypothetical protein
MNNEGILVPVLIICGIADIWIFINSPKSSDNIISGDPDFALHITKYACRYKF